LNTFIATPSVGDSIELQAIENIDIVQLVESHVAQVNELSRPGTHSANLQVGSFTSRVSAAVQEAKGFML
jgi:hypothetical protein